MCLAFVHLTFVSVRLQLSMSQYGILHFRGQWDSFCKGGAKDLGSEGHGVWVLIPHSQMWHRMGRCLLKAFRKLHSIMQRSRGLAYYYWGPRVYPLDWIATQGLDPFQPLPWAQYGHGPNISLSSGPWELAVRVKGGSDSSTPPHPRPKHFPSLPTSPKWCLTLEVTEKTLFWPLCLVLARSLPSCLALSLTSPAPYSARDLRSWVDCPQELGDP